MKIEQFFTEYDEAISGTANIDPLGTLVIWSVYGQRIFRNRISSVSNDARSYTLNLFHHNLIRKLVENDGISLSSTLTKSYPSKNSLAFKQACLIHLENLFVFSIVENERKHWKKDVDASGVLGVTKARRRWIEGGNFELGFGNGPGQQILVRQLLLGVSGRCKTPMLEMGFFDKSYHYDLEKSQLLWQQADRFIQQDKLFTALEARLVEHFRPLLKLDEKIPKVTVRNIPEDLKKAYVQAFPSSSSVGARARHFWLTATELDKGVPRALLEELDSIKDKKRIEALTAKEIYVRAKARLQNSENRSDKGLITHIQQVEPFLADLDLLFTLMICKKNRTVADVERSWTQYQRKPETIPQKARKLQLDSGLLDALSGTGRSRLDSLLQLGAATHMENQIRSLLAYHKKVMEARGQSPWLEINDNGAIRVYVRRPAEPDPAGRLPNSWVHHYYIPQFINLVRGFQGAR